MNVLNHRDLHFIDLSLIPAGRYRLVAAGERGKLYAVFDDGRLWSTLEGRYIEGDIDRDGYRIVTVGGMRTKMHRLVLYVFRGPAPGRGMVTRHLDGNPSNNCIDNLAWGTPAENWNDKRRHGTATVGERSGRVKLTDDEVRVIRDSEEPTKTLSARYGVSDSLISLIRNGKHRRNVA
ncbi:MAG: HNH endonuclease [Sphingobacteriia bacterium]|nr:HNH endonuclease [Sphingobacteriia bacterium]